MRNGAVALTRGNGEMTPLGMRWVEHIHGHLGWLATLALFHPALLLRRGKRRALLSAVLATALVSVTAGLGAFLYPAYRALLKPQIFASSSAIGDAFERKEHLAIAVVVLSWVGLLTHCAEGAGRTPRVAAPRIAFVAYAGAALLATASAVLGLAVAAFRSF
jgi:hypothetical protein